jgi:IS5 family transposase
LPIRLMVALRYLKHAFDLSDEQRVERWSETVVWQFFCGMDYYQHKLPCRPLAWLRPSAYTGDYISPNMKKGLSCFRT